MVSNMQNSLIDLGAPQKTQRTERPKGSQKTGASAKDEFQKLMSDRRPTDHKSDDLTKADAETVQKPEGETQTAPVVKTPEEELRERMMLAAMAFVQGPQQIELQPEEFTAGAEELKVADTAEVQTPELNVQQSAKTPAEQAQTEETAAPEDGQVQPQKTGQTQTAPREDRAEFHTEQPKVQDEQEESLPVEKMELKQGAEVETPLFHEVENIPVKVGEAAPAEKTEQTPVDQIHDQLAEALRKGETTLEMELTPEHLGKVKVEMVWHKDGSIHVLLHADKPKTQALLDRDAGQLESLLGRNNQQEVRVEAPREQESARPQYDEGHQGHPQQEQQQERREQREHKDSGEDFLHQLRLGLTPVDETL